MEMEMKMKIEESGHYVYKECQKNYAASMGGHAVDGCQEFIASEHGDGGFWCAACGCHRNFHNRVRVIKAMRRSPSRKPRTKFSLDQKYGMLEFAESIGWRISNATKQELEVFLERVRVSREVFRIWMHNHRHESAHGQISGAAESSSTESDEGAAANENGNGSA